MKKKLSIIAMLGLFATSAMAFDVNVLVGKGTAKVVNSADTSNVGIEIVKDFDYLKEKNVYLALGARYMYKHLTINGYDADSNTFTGEAKVGYVFNVKQFKVIPNIGFTYSYQDLKDNGSTADGWGAGYQLALLAKYKRYNFGVEYSYYKPHITTDNGLSGDLKNRSTNLFVGYSF